MIKSHIISSKEIDSKGQKIVAALYLLTAHVGNEDPLRTKIRAMSLMLIDDSHSKTSIVKQLTGLLRIGLLARLFSEGNVKIIESELATYAYPHTESSPDILNLFPYDNSDKGQFLQKRTEEINMSFKSQYVRNHESQKQRITKEFKDKRQDKILSFINERKSVNIKDIASLFPTISEKTIQRELGVLVATRKITKRGDKRWSVYMAVQQQ